MQGKQAKMVSLTQERAMLGYLATTRYRHRIASWSCCR
jgi:hypothetical protein